MLRKQSRQRREFFYKKSRVERIAATTKLKDNLRKNLEKNTNLSGKLASKGVDLYDKLKYDTEGDKSLLIDEYNNAGCEDPKIMITTSHDPSARLKMFTKELRLVFPNAQQMNRGNYQLSNLMHACRSNNVTDFLIVHEHRGVPDCLVVSHLPYGPTAFFNISEVIMRHDIPDIGPVSEEKPHLIFNNFKSQLGIRTMTILKHLFPVPKEKSKRIMTFVNNDDQIIFRHHRYQYVNSELELKEVGPRFQLKLYQIKLGTLDNLKASNTEWVYRPYLNTAIKRRVISDEEGILKQNKNNFQGS